MKNLTSKGNNFLIFFLGDKNDFQKGRKKYYFSNKIYTHEIGKEM